jgi:hypothetical protein
MPSTIVTIPGVGDVEFPDAMSADDVNAAAKRLYDEANPPPPTGAAGGRLTTKQGDSGLTGAGLGLAAAAPAVAAAIPAAVRLAEEVATNPTVSRASRLVKSPLGSLASKLPPPLARLVPGLNAASTAKQVADVLTGRQSPADAGADAVKTYAVSRIPSAIQRGAGWMARALAAASAPATAGALLGAGVPLTFLGALEHDANRRVVVPRDETSLRSSIFTALGGNVLRR